MIYGFGVSYERSSSELIGVACHNKPHFLDLLATCSAVDAAQKLVLAVSYRSGRANKVSPKRKRCNQATEPVGKFYESNTSFTIPPLYPLRRVQLSIGKRRRHLLPWEDGVAPRLSWSAYNPLWVSNSVLNDLHFPHTETVKFIW